METRPEKRILTIGAAALFGIAFGYFLFDDSEEMLQLRSKLDQVNRPGIAGRPGGSAVIRKRLPRGLTTSNSASTWRPSELFARMGITAEDWEKTQTLERLRSEGEYVLQNERPTTRKVLEYDFNQIVSKAAKVSAADYSRVFSELGISPEAGEKLQAHLAKIHKASLEAEVAIQQLLQARKDYAERLRPQVGEEGYARYRQYEDSKPAVREFLAIQKFAELQGNSAVAGGHEQAMIGLIQEAKAYTIFAAGGPFDGLPEVAIGSDAVLEAAAKRINTLTERSAQLLDRVAISGLTEECKNFLAAYFAERIRQKSAVRDRIMAGIRDHNIAETPQATRHAPVP